MSKKKNYPQTVDTRFFKQQQQDARRHERAQERVRGARPIDQWRDKCGAGGWLFNKFGEARQTVEGRTIRIDPQSARRLFERGIVLTREHAGKLAYTYDAASINKILLGEE